MNKTHLFAITAFLTCLIVYILTLAPDTTFTDSGELAGVCASLGVAHPTGYPLFAIIGHLWTWLPLPFSMIFKLNLLSAFLTAAAAYVFFFNTSVLLHYFNSKNQDKPKNKKVNVEPVVPTVQLDLISFAATLIFGFSLTIWGQATFVEVYPLHLLLMNISLFFTIKAALDKNSASKFWFAAALALGLGFANHLTTLLLVPGIILIFFYKPDSGFIFSKNRFKLLLWLALPFIIGLSFYLYLPLRSAAMPEFNWGWVHRGFDKLIYHISGKQYQIWMFSGFEAWSENFNRFFGSLPYQLGWLGLIPLVWGFIRLYITSKPLFWFLLTFVLSCIAYSFNYSIHDIDTYFLTAFVAFFLVIAIGLLYLVKKKSLLLYAACVIPVISLAQNYNDNDRSNDWLVSEYTRIITDFAAPNAIIISSQWDFWCSAFWYKQRIEGVRPDIVLVEKELMRRTWYPYQFARWYSGQAELCKPEIDRFMLDLENFEEDLNYDPRSIQANYVNMLNCFIDKNYPARPIYITPDIISSEQEIGKDYNKIPDGFLIRLTKDTTSVALEIDKYNFLKLMASMEKSKGRLETGIRSTASMNLTYLGRYAMLTGQMTQANKAFYIALKLDPTNKIAMQGLGEMGK